jgi:hypothetical protein
MTDVAALGPAVPRPARIPPSAVHDFDFFPAPAYLADPHQRILELAETAPPVFRTPRNGGHSMFINHSANFRAWRDTESFTGRVVTQAQMTALMAQLPPGTPHIPEAVPIKFHGGNVIGVDTLTPVWDA